MMKKVIRFFCSMKFALILLIIMVLVCTAGSVIPQGDSLEYYAQTYSKQMAEVITALGLDDVFHCWWFVALTIILCVNLLGCNLIHFPALIRRTKKGFQLENCLKRWDGNVIAVTAMPEEIFAKAGFRKISRRMNGMDQNAMYSVKNQIGIWGAWFCHLGMLIVIIGFGLGQVMKTEYTVYGVPGQTLTVGDTGYELTIDDFEIGLREDDTVEQYTAELTLTNTATGESGHGFASVNNPLSLSGMKLYQNSTGWAAVMEVWRDGVKIQENLLCAGEYAKLDEIPDVVIMLSAFYPDYANVDGTPMTVSSQLNNPGYLYRIYAKNEMLGMNVLTGDEEITLEDYVIRFRDPQSYTLIQIKRDPFTPVAAVGGVIVMAALILAFYFRTAELWAVELEAGMWAVAGRSRKGGAEFVESIKKACDSSEPAKQ